MIDPLSCRHGWVALALLPALVDPVSARTISLTADDCDQIAVISSAVPRMSWAIANGTALFATYSSIQLYPNMAVLMRFPLDKIPKGQRITKADLTVPVSYTAGVKQRLYLRRLLVEWGAGVCHEYRMVNPKKLSWSKPGALGVTSDRANKVSAIFKIDNAGDVSVDVTQDIELWYTGAVANHGWIFTLDDTGAIIYMPIPYPTGASWKLNITYEPR